LRRCFVDEQGAPRSPVLTMIDNAPTLARFASAGPINRFEVRSVTGASYTLVEEVDRDAINAEVKRAAEGPLKGILEYCTDPIVSSDVVGNPASSVFDSLSTMVLGGNLVKVLSWYDNEWGFSNRVVDALVMMA
jgi:glyceraldehyde-3-phosphate dehydrogenase/erythrose-4-phosphate dehydrogenase